MKVGAIMSAKMHYTVHITVVALYNALVKFVKNWEQYPNAWKSTLHNNSFTRQVEGREGGGAGGLLRNMRNNVVRLLTRDYK